MPIDVPPPSEVTTAQTQAVAATDAAARRSLLTQFSSVLALAISFLALATGAYQTRLMQQQARASVWPSLSVGYSYFGEGENAGFTWLIDNNGVGPARIQSISMSLDDKPMQRWTDVFAGLQIDPNSVQFVTVFNINGKVLPSNTNRETAIAAIKIDANQLDIAKAFFNARDRFKMSICYCSVYDECWVTQWRQQNAASVPRCEAAAVPFLQ